MASKWILLPVLIHIIMVITLLVLLGIRKAAAIKRGDVDRQQTALNNKAWPDDVLQVSNNIANQFEVPVLFYALCLIFHALHAVSMTVVVLAWVFALSRVAHAFVHITSNHVPTRMRVYIIGVLTVLAMAIIGTVTLIS